MRQVEFILPYPPSANFYWRTVNGHPVVSEAAKVYKSVVASLLAGLVPQPWAGSIRLEIAVYRPRKVGDLSNTLKVLEDALRGIVFVDDKQVEDIALRRHDDKDRPRACVRVTEDPDVAMGRFTGAGIPTHAEWGTALARLEAVRQKNLERRKAKAERSGKAPTPAKSASWRTPLPPTSSPGAESYGSRHRGEFQTAPVGRPKKPTAKQLRDMAKPATYGPGESS